MYVRKTAVETRSWLSMFFASALWGVSMCALGSPAATPPGSTPDTVLGTPELTKADVDVWLDGLIPHGLATGNVAGAVVVVVKDGRILTERGYGYSDVEAKKVVDPQTTLFRPASTSKLFTWTAVMQQVQAGKLDLDRDVNDYLDFKLPSYRGQPITMRHLMTHTAGFEERLEDLQVMGGSVPSISDTVKAWIPKRIFAPGTTPAYSNYATLLAGYIVERVSGQPYDDYIDQHIFRPLGMTHSTMVQPLSARLSPLMSKGYYYATETPVPFEMTAFRPAGSATSTAPDMARFMLAYLDEDRNPLLAPRIAHEMQTAVLTQIPPLNRMHLGFYEQNINGLRIIGHGGDTNVFHSYLWLIPEHKTGVFFSMNSRGTGLTQLSFRQTVITEFVKRYYPNNSQPLPAFRSRPAEAQALAGSYVVSRRSESNFLKLLSYLDEVTVKIEEGGNIRIQGDFFADMSGEPRRWTQIAPFVWKDDLGIERFAAKVVSGKVVRIATDSWSPFMVFDRIPWYETKAWLQATMVINAIILLILVLSPAAGAIARRHYGGTQQLQGRERIAYRWSVGSGLAVLVLAGIWLGVMLSLSLARLPSWMYVVQLATMIAPLVLCVATLSLLLLGIVAKRGVLNLVCRIALVVASIWISWFAFAFHFASFGLSY